MKLNLLRSSLLFALLFTVPVVMFSQKTGNPVIINDVQDNSNVSKAETVYGPQHYKVAPTQDTDRLKKLKREFEARYSRLKNEAEAYALLNNIPLRRYEEDGSFSELQRLATDGTPIYYSLGNANAAISTRANYLNTGGGLGLTLDGDNITAHVWDGGPTRPTHQEFDGAGGTNRVTINDGATTLNGNSFHAQHVTGTIVASGVQAAAKGMAWQADALTHDWNSDLSEATTEAANGMLLSNHSYGFRADLIPDWYFGAYIGESRDWDALMYSAPYYLMVVAAGNDGNDNSSNGAPLNGNSTYDKLSGHSTSKNNLVVANGLDANIDGSGNLISVSRNSSSSEGPTDDLRIKPDIMGNGTGVYSTFDNSDTAYASISGTSMASPNVTGSLLLLQEHYNNVHASYMRAATLKGLALHTADDAGSAGPDVEYGWGLLNAKAAAETITTADAGGNAIISELTLNQGQTYQITVQSDGVNPLLASISWTDPAGTANTGTTNLTTPVLVNDLDIRLDNGSTFTPWRLVSLPASGPPTNGTGDNIVDPFERIDISGASGQYTLTVTHKGTLSSGSQNFTLIVTGASLAPATPEISFATPTGSTTEDSNCSHTDINVPLNIGLGASANADVNFTINGTSTATTGLDFELMTPSVTFPAGSTATQNMVLRVHHDGFIESPETVVIDFTVNPNGGDASANTNADQFTFTINNDDAAPMASSTVTLYSEDFDDGSYDVTTGGNAGSTFWAVSTAGGASSTFWTIESTNTTNIAFTNDDACNCDKGNDQLITTSIDLSGAYTSATLTFDHAFADVGAEAGNVLVSTDGTNFNSVLALSNTSTNNGGGSYTTPWVNGVSVDMSSYIGQSNVQVMFLYNDGGGWAYGMAVDNILLNADINTPIQTAINSGAPDQIDIPAAGTVYTSDPTSGDVMADITNNNADDYGCVDISVSRSGTGAQSYNGSISPDLVMDKTFDITPTNVIAGSTGITFYFTLAEITGWESATGLSRNVLVAGRGNASAIAETSALTVGSFGTDITLTGSFAGLDGTFYFGTSDAFNACAGVTKTWNGANWSPAGAPGSTDSVIINGNYDTSVDGDLSACNLTVNTGMTLTVGADSFAQVENGIVVDGSLIVEHTGNLVQVENDASAINNGTINVNVTTPVLQTRDFMVMGSPMSAETRTGVYNSAFLVLQHTPANFIPHSGVPPGGTNFADDNGDFWNQFAAGPINVGEGYIVRPQSSYTDPANIAYNFTYSQGTLNNGTVNRTVVYNGVGSNPHGTPNVFSNPYPSAISATDFINANALVNEVYFWEHLTPPSSALPGAGGYNFSMDDISMYNLSGGVAAANDPGTSTEPNGTIATSQGFAIKATGAGTVSFTNAMRRTTGNNTLRSPDLEVNRAWLTVSNAQYEIKSNMLLAFNPIATEGLDPGYDTDRIATVISLYSHLEDGSEQLGIQTREAFEDGLKVPLGFATQVIADLEYTISLSDLEGAMIEEATVYLIDTELNTVTNLTQEDYTFRSGEGTFNGRFSLQFEYQVLGTGDALLDTVIMYPNPTHNLLHIKAPSVGVNTIEVHDITGRVVTTISANGEDQYTIDLSSYAPAVYFVTIHSDSGTLTRRIIRE